jgi:hypothetical protein
VSLDQRLGVLEAVLLQPALGGFHGTTVRRPGVDRMSPGQARGFNCNN